MKRIAKKEKKTVLEFAVEQAKAKEAACRTQTSKGYRTLVTHLRRFSYLYPSGDAVALGFDEWREGQLIDFKNYLHARGCCSNSIQLYLRRLHALHCAAAERKLAKKPDARYACVFQKEEPTRHQPLSAQSLCLIRDASFGGRQSSLQFASQLFTLSFYLCGIPFVDLAHLRHSDLREGRLYYRRSKTGRPLVVVLNRDMLAIIERLRNTQEESPYLFPIIKRPGEPDEAKQYESALRAYNKQLRRVQALLQIKEKLSSYTPRYSWANLAMERGISLSYVSAALGHASEKTTRHYVSTFKPELLGEANEWVLKGMDNAAQARERKKEKSFWQGAVSRNGLQDRVPVLL